MANKLQFTGKKVKLGDCLSESFSGEWGKADGDLLTPVFRTANFNDDGTFDYSMPAMRCIPESKVAKKRLQRGDVVLEKSGGTPNRPVGTMAYYDRDDLATCSNFNQVLRFDPSRMNPRFAFYQLRWLRSHGAFQPYTRKTTGLQNLQMKAFTLLELRAPSFEVQSECSSVLLSIEEQVRDVERGMSELDNLVKSRFVEMFGNPADIERNTRWPVYEVIEKCECIVPARNKPKAFDGDIPWITTEDLRADSTTYKSNKGLALTRDAISEVGQKTIPAGSVIMSCVGRLGICSIAGCEMVINQQLHSFQCGPEVNNIYLARYLSYQVEYMQKAANAVTVLYMNKASCNSIPLILPPLYLQQEFADFVAQVDKSRFVAQQQIEKLQMLYDSLAQDYFG